MIHALGTDLSNQSTNSIDQIEFDGRLVENYTTEPTENQQSSYPYMDDLKHLESCKPLHNTDTAIPPSALSIVTPLITHQWEEELSYHPDQEFVAGLANGFCIGYQYHRST